MSVEDYLLTLLPLDRFRREVCGDIDPYHFWQMTIDGHPEHGYSHVYPHERWMYTEHVDAGAPISMPGEAAKRGPSRLEFLQAIARAEERLADTSELNTWPGPKYTELEWVNLVRPSTWKVTYPVRQVPYGLLTRWWNVQEVGTQTWDIQVDGLDISGDYDATDDVEFTATVEAGTSASEVVITYPDTVVPIRPIEVTVAGTTATIIVKKWLMGNPDDWETATPIDANDTANLLQTVDVYRVWIDPSSQVTIYWEPSLLLCHCDDSESCQVCTMGGYTACAFNKDYHVGHVGWQFAEWDADGETYTRTSVSCRRFPDRARISYVHGFDAGNDRYMSSRWARVVSILAAASMADYVYDTTSQSQQLYYWREDFAKTEGKSRHAMSASDLGNPFGTKRGHIEAWKEVKRAIGGW